MGVINKDGALYFATGIDNSGLKKDSEEAKRYIQDIANFAKSTGAVLGTAFSVGVLKNWKRPSRCCSGERACRHSCPK